VKQLALVCESMRLTQRPADAATPRANRGGFSGKGGSACRVTGRPRRAADAIVGRGRGEAESPAMKPQAAGESEHTARPEQKARNSAGRGKAG